MLLYKASLVWCWFISNETCLWSWSLRISWFASARNPILNLKHDRVLFRIKKTCLVTERTFCFFPIAKNVDRVSITEVVRSTRKHEEVLRSLKKSKEVPRSREKYEEVPKSTEVRLFPLEDVTIVMNSALKRWWTRRRRWREWSQYPWQHLQYWQRDRWRYLSW